MQYSPHPSYQGPQQGGTDTRGGTQYLTNAPSTGYDAHFSVPQSYTNCGPHGGYNAPSNLRSPQATTSGSLNGAYETPRGSKRARLDEGQEIGTQARMSEGWDPLPGCQSHPSSQQHRGLALPPMPSAVPLTNSGSRQSLLSDTIHGQQATSCDDVPSHLEHQVRGLAEYSSLRNTRTASFSSIQQHGQAGSPDDGLKLQSAASSSYSSLPQRGAKEGKMLNLSCESCKRKKRKCSKDFPCTDCVKDGDQCTPSARKQRGQDRDLPIDDQPAELPDQETSDAAEQEAGSVQKRISPRDHEELSKKHILTLPKAVDGYQQWSNMRLKYNPIPTDIDAVREKFFKFEKPMLLNSQQFAEYWPHISNIYKRAVGPDFDANGAQTETWECRNQRRQSRNQRIKGSSGEGKRKRERKIHLLEGTEMCKIRFRIVTYIKHGDTEEGHDKGLGNCNCVPEWLFMERTRFSADINHNHTLESLDKYKRTDAMLHFAEHKVMEGGYLYHTVRKWIHEKYGHISKEVGYLTDHDVANAARRWRIANRDLELVDTIPEPSPEDEQVEKCLKLLQTTTVDGLQIALREVCSRLPEAAEIVLPFLESSQLPNAKRGDETCKILEGDEIVIPAPGVSEYIFNKLYTKFTASYTPQTERIVGHTNGGTDLRTIQGPATAKQTWQTPNQSTPASQPPQYPLPQLQPLPPPQLSAQSYLPAPLPMAPPPPPPVNSPFRVYQPGGQTPLPILPSPLNAAHSVISGAHRVRMPAVGSKVGSQMQDARPSWAKTDMSGPTEGKEKANVETDEVRVQRQLDAELQA